jgi:hypothetical protein
MAESIDLTDEMRAVIGVPSSHWRYELTTTSVRAFARGVGYRDRVYYEMDAAHAAGYVSIPAPPCYLGTPLYVPDEVDDTFSVPPTVSSRPKFGLSRVLDGGTEISYERLLLAGETLSANHTIADLEVKRSESLGAFLLVTTESEFRDGGGAVVARERAQVIFY